MSYGRKAFNQQVSVEELMHLRSEGRSNAEIATLLGTSRQTILKYIGKQPKEITSRVMSESQFDAWHTITRKSRSSTKPKDERPMIREESSEMIDACLQIENPTVKAIGLYATYEISTENGMVSVCTNARGERFVVARDELEAFANELLAIKRNISSVVKRNNTMW